MTATLVFMDGWFAEHLSDTHLLPKDILFCPLYVDGLHGIFLYVPENCIISTPIYLLFQSTGNKKACYLYNTIIVEHHSQLVLIEEYQGEASENDLTHMTADITLGKNAMLRYGKLQHENPHTKHHAAIFIQQQEASHSAVFFADYGAQWAETHWQIHLHQKQAVCDLRGLYRTTQEGQKIHHHVYMDHIAEYSASTIHCKGILDKHSHATFVGKVYVHEKAQHVTAHQTNHHLLLSDHADVSTNPELEIYADDVQCSHGATVGQLDEEALFYLRSRGIEKEAALQLLMQAFYDDIVNTIEPIAFRRYIQERMSQYETV